MLTTDQTWIQIDHNISSYFQKLLLSSFVYYNSLWILNRVYAASSVDCWPCTKSTQQSVRGGGGSLSLLPFSKDGNLYMYQKISLAREQQCEWVHARACVQLRVCAWVLELVHVWVLVQIHVRGHVQICVCIWIHVWVCTSLCISLSYSQNDIKGDCFSPQIHRPLPCT